jgi:hypothetical protein
MGGEKKGRGIESQASRTSHPTHRRAIKHIETLDYDHFDVSVQRKPRPPGHPHSPFHGKFREKIQPSEWYLIEKILELMPDLAPYIAKIAYKMMFSEERKDADCLKKDVAPVPWHEIRRWIRMLNFSEDDFPPEGPSASNIRRVKLAQRARKYVNSLPTVSEQHAAFISIEPKANEFSYTKMTPDQRAVAQYRHSLVYGSPLPTLIRRHAKLTAQGLIPNVDISALIEQMHTNGHIVKLGRTSNDLWSNLYVHKTSTAELLVNTIADKSTDSTASTPPSTPEVAFTTGGSSAVARTIRKNHVFESNTVGNPTTSYLWIDRPNGARLFLMDMVYYTAGNDMRAFYNICAQAICMAPQFFDLYNSSGYTKINQTDTWQVSFNPGNGSTIIYFIRPAPGNDSTTQYAYNGNKINPIGGSLVKTRPPVRSLAEGWYTIGGSKNIVFEGSNLTALPSSYVVVNTAAGALMSIDTSAFAGTGYTFASIYNLISQAINMQVLFFKCVSARYPNQYIEVTDLWSSYNFQANDTWMIWTLPDDTDSNNQYALPGIPINPLGGSFYTRGGSGKQKQRKPKQKKGIEPAPAKKKPRDKHVKQAPRKNNKVHKRLKAPAIAHNSGMSPCAAKFLQAISKPWDIRSRGACVPYRGANSTQKATGFLRLSMTIGTNGVGFVLISPCVANDVPTCYITGATFAGTSAAATTDGHTLATGVTAVSMGNLPYNSSTLGDDTLVGRVVTTGASIQYNGTRLNLGGNIYSYTSESRVNMMAQSVNTLTAYDECEVVNNKGQKVWNVAYPNCPMEMTLNLAERQWDTAEHAATSQSVSTMACYPLSSGAANVAGNTTNNWGCPIMVIIATGLAGNTYEVDIVTHAEYFGQVADSMSTPNTIDDEGIDRVVAVASRATQIAASEGGSWSNMIKRAFIEVVHEAAPIALTAALSLL